MLVNVTHYGPIFDQLQQMLANGQTDVTSFSTNAFCITLSTLFKHEESQHLNKGQSLRIHVENIYNQLSGIITKGIELTLIAEKKKYKLKSIKKISADFINRAELFGKGTSYTAYGDKYWKELGKVSASDLNNLMSKLNLVRFNTYGFKSKNCGIKHSINYMEYSPNEFLKTQLANYN